MAFITYRVSTTPTLATANVAKGLQLTNSEIDANFKALDDGKLEKNGSAASLTGLPLTTGVTDILPVTNGGTGSSTASTGSGGVVLATSPTLVTPSLGIPSFLDLTNARNLPLDGTIAVSGKLPIAFGGTNSTATPTAGTIPYGTGTAYAFTAAGTTGQVLTSAGAGTPTWATITTSAGGSNTQLQYNSSGSFAGSANMTFNGTTLALNSLSVTNASTLTGGASIPLATASTSTTTGALTVAGGVGIAGRLNIGSTVTAPDVTSLLTTANTYPTTRPSLNLDFANSATLDPRITFIRGTNATYTGSDGLVKNTAGINSPRFDWDPVTRECKGLLIEEARTNLLTYSNDMNKGNWGVYAPMLTAIPSTVLAPNGTYSAYRFNTTNAGSFYQDFDGTNGTGTYTGSIYISKLSTCTNLTVTAYFVWTTVENFGGVTINPQTAVNTTTSAYTITDLGNNWLRVTFTKTGSYSANIAIRFQIYNNTGSADSIIAWGAQMEVGAFATSYIPSSVTWTGRASTATYVGSNGLIQTAASGVARYQYNPTNLSVAPFLLLEPVATNLLTYSEQFDNANWSKNATPATSNATTAPDGTNTADLITDNTTAGVEHYLEAAVSTYANQTYTQSVYVKAATAATAASNFLFMVVSVGASYSTSVIQFNQSAGQYTSAWQSNNLITSSSVVSVGGGWYRCSVTYTLNGTASYHTMRIYPYNGGFYAGTTIGHHFWGAQVETGSVATSYIPTVASQVTRIADTSTSAQTTRSGDLATMTDSNFSSWYNQTEGTFVVNAKRNSLGGSAYPGVFYVDNGSAGTSLGVVFLDSPGTLFYEAYVDDINVMAGVVASSVLANTSYKVSVGYKLNNAASVANTGILQSSSPTVLPIVNRLIIGRLRGGNLPLNGTIAKLTYYPTRLSNSTLQALTT